MNECILIRIKYKKTNEHLKTHGILALPSIETIQKYLLHTKGVYDFQTGTFKYLKEKASYTRIEEKEVVLLNLEILEPSL